MNLHQEIAHNIYSRVYFLNYFVLYYSELHSVFFIFIFQNLTSINSASQEDLNRITLSDSENLLASVRKRLQSTSEKVDVASLNVLSAKYESLDYDTCENYLLLDEERQKGYKYIVRKNLARWFIFLLIGVVTALVACAIDISIEELSKIKYAALSKCIL